jgi:hypothetical protein
VILYLASALVAGAGFAVLGWYAHAWDCRRMNPHCPVWQREREAVWKAEWRRQHPATRAERHGTTELVIPKDLLDSLPEAGAPLPIESTPTTGVANPRRKVP